MTAIDPTLEAAARGGSRRPAPAPDQAMLAHDIRVHLQGVIGGVAALEASRLPPDLAEQVERVAAAATSLADLIGTAIDHPLDAGDEPGAALDLAEFLDHFRSRWVGEARDRGTALRICSDDDLPRGLRVSRLSLSRMLGNLTSNALAHSSGGAVAVSFARSPDGGVIMVVTDEGPGIPAAVVEGLFGASTNSADGARHGLGLPIVRDLARAAGCDFSLENRREGGTQATLIVPPALCLEADPPQPAPAGLAVAPKGLAGLRVLLAEDNQTNQLVATQMLRALDVEVTVAGDGIEALERFEGQQFDVLLVDIEMPRLSGLDVIRRIRGRGDARASVPIVALTAYALHEHCDRIAEAGADGLISKPITSVEVLERGLSAHVPAWREAPPCHSSPPEEAAAADAAPVIDPDVFEALASAIGEDMMGELLDKVIADLQSAQDELAAARLPIDRSRIRSSAHILISVAGAIGAGRLQNGARALHAAAQEAGGTPLAPEVDRCIAEIGAAVAFARSQRVAV